MNAGSMTTLPDVKTEAKLSLKFQKWCKLFTDETSETYGNATKSALKAYKTKSYSTAGTIGHENLKKLKNLGLMFTESNGVDVKELWKILAAKAIKGSYEQTLSFMERIGVIDPVAPGAANQNNFQFNFADLAASFTQARRERGLPVNPTHNTLEDELKRGETPANP